MGHLPSWTLKKNIVSVNFTLTYLGHFIREKLIRPSNRKLPRTQEAKIRAKQIKTAVRKLKQKIKKIQAVEKRTFIIALKKTVSLSQFVFCCLFFAFF